MRAWLEKWVVGRKGLPPAWILALDSHIAWGFGVPSFFGWAARSSLLGAAVILVIAFFKELFADPYFEGEPFLWNGVEDMLEYGGGVLLAEVLGYGVSLYLGFPFRP